MDEGNFRSLGKKRGRKKWKPSLRARLTVEIMTAAGYHQAQIAERIKSPSGVKMKPQNLRRYFGYEIDAGHAGVVSAMAASLYQYALGLVPGCPHELRLRALIFGLKTQGRWVEARAIVEHEMHGKFSEESADGTPMPAGVPLLTLNDLYAGRLTSEVIAAAANYSSGSTDS